jgi:hypothetical protein
MVAGVVRLVSVNLGGSFAKDRPVVFRTEAEVEVSLIIGKGHAGFDESLANPRGYVSSEQRSWKEARPIWSGFSFDACSGPDRVLG